MKQPELYLHLPALIQLLKLSFERPLASAPSDDLLPFLRGRHRLAAHRLASSSLARTNALRGQQRSSWMDDSWEELHNDLSAMHRTNTEA